MPEPGLIQNYLATLSGQLPAPVVAELADGLEETRQHYLRQGLDPDAAAEAAVAEFGEPGVIVTAFIQASPARRAACTLLATGPVVGACWAVALITGRAWAWPVPDLGRVLIGLALLAVIGLLAAARGTRYRACPPRGSRRMHWHCIARYRRGYRRDTCCSRDDLGDDHRRDRQRRPDRRQRTDPAPHPGRVTSASLEQAAEVSAWRAQL
jgi:hypothetical protein